MDLPLHWYGRSAWVWGSQSPSPALEGQNPSVARAWGQPVRRGEEGGGAILTIRPLLQRLPLQAAEELTLPDRHQGIS